MKVLTVIGIQMRKFFRNKKAWIFLILLPLLFSYFALGLFEEEGKETKIPLVLVDEDQSTYSRMLIELLEQEEYLEILEKDLESGLEALRENRVEGVYQIQEGFESRIRRDRIPELVSYTTAVAQGGNAVGEIILSRSIRILSSARAANIVVSEAKNNGAVEDEEALWQASFEKSESYWEPEPLMTLSLEEVVAKEGGAEIREASSSSKTVGFLAGPRGLIIIYITLFSLRVFYQRQEEEALGVTERQRFIIGKSSLYIGKFIGDFLYLTLHHGLLIVSIYLFQGKTLGGDLFHQILLILMIQVLLIGIWTVLSKQKIGKDSFVVGLPIGVLITSMISGALWSIEVFPSDLQRIAWLMPQGIYMKAVEYSHLGETTAFYTSLLWGIVIGLLLLWIGFKKEAKF